MQKSSVVAYQEPFQDTKGACNTIAASTKWKRRLKNPNDVRRWLAGLLLDVRAGRIGCEQAKTETYICSIIARLISDSELELRISNIEEGLRGR